ncbi:unnamed protein product [Gongylonema pulchrum]|uniref:Uncharacterized protein n=1 Tax=Gongylonema pulchrum TaxID=637853 RepID=A0A3P7P9G7_9BILA|nr:unnamed protein product [Gongylonema pulchrum]
MSILQAMSDLLPAAENLSGSETKKSRSRSSSSSSINDLTVGKDSAQALALTKKRLEMNDSDDDLNCQSVNLVALDEIASGQYKCFLMSTVVATDELARHSPGSMRRSRRRFITGSETAAMDTRSCCGSCSSISDLDLEASIHGPEGSYIGLMKSVSDISCKKSTAEVSCRSTDASIADDKMEVVAVDRSNESRNGRNSPSSSCKCQNVVFNVLENIILARRSRFPYCFKHHTVSFLTVFSELDNRLISTDVLFGKSGDAARRRLSNSKLVILASADLTVGLTLVLELL